MKRYPKPKYAETPRCSGDSHGWSRTFVARYPKDECPRCGNPIQIGQDLRYHNDYPDPVHSNCKSGDRAEPAYVLIGARQPEYCGLCFMEHSGECL